MNKMRFLLILVLCHAFIMGCASSQIMSTRPEYKKDCETQVWLFRRSVFTGDGSPFPILLNGITVANLMPENYIKICVKEGDFISSGIPPCILNEYKVLKGIRKFRIDKTWTICATFVLEFFPLTEQLAGEYEKRMREVKNNRN